MLSGGRNANAIGQQLWLRELETYRKFPPSGSGELQPGSGHGTAQEGIAPEPVGGGDEQTVKKRAVRKGCPLRVRQCR